MPKSADRYPFRLEDFGDGHMRAHRFILPGETGIADRGGARLDKDGIEQGDDQGTGRQHREEHAPVGGERQRNAKREVHGDRKAVGGEDHANHGTAARLREPAEDQLHVADEDGGVEEADDEAKDQQLHVALHEDLQNHADACTDETDQKHVARRHVATERRPGHHADADRDCEDALGETGLRRVQVQGLRDEGNHGGERVPVGSEKHLADEGERQHPFLPGPDTSLVGFRESAQVHVRHLFVHRLKFDKTRTFRLAAAGN